VNPRRTASALVAAAATAAVLWAYASHRAGARPGAPAPIPIRDGSTIDFSGGSPVVGNSAADKAALEAGVRAIDEAQKGVTFPAQPTPAK